MACGVSGIAAGCLFVARSGWCGGKGEGGVETKEELLEGEVDEELEERERLGVEQAFESRLCLELPPPPAVLKRLDLLRKLPLPNMSPAFGCSAQ